jgi:hypothetical protein
VGESDENMAPSRVEGEQSQEEDSAPTGTNPQQEDGDEADADDVSVI